MLQPFRGGEGGRTGEGRGKKSPRPQPVLSLTPRPPRLPGRDPPAPHGAGGRAQQPSRRVYFNYHLLCAGPTHSTAGTAERDRPNEQGGQSPAPAGSPLLGWKDELGDGAAGPLMWGRERHVGESGIVPQKGPWATGHLRPCLCRAVGSPPQGPDWTSRQPCQSPSLQFLFFAGSCEIPRGSR